MAGVQSLDHRFRQYARHDVGLHRQRRHPIAPPDQRIFLLILECRELAERYGAAAGKRYLNRCADVSTDIRCSSVARRHDVDQIDVVPDLRDRGTGDDGVEDARDRL